MSFLKGLFGSNQNKKIEDNKSIEDNEKIEVNEKNEDEKGEDVILQCLKEKCLEKNIGSEIINHELIFRDYEMSIKAIMGNKTQHPNALIIQLDFIVHQESFDDEIIESLSGIGEGNNINDAIENGVSSFVDAILITIIRSFYDTHDPKLDFETNLGDCVQTWYPKIGQLHAQGYIDVNTVDENRIFNILKDEIKLRLGHKRFYWIKVYVLRQPNGEIITQCSLNNEPFFIAQQKMEEYAQNWESANQFRGEKQYIVLRQCDETWEPSKYANKDIKDFVFGAIELFEECSTEADYNLLIEKIANLSGDIDLAFELFCLIPEIYCQITLPTVKYSDEIILVNPDESFTSIFISQFSTYALIKKLVKEKLHLTFNKDKYERVLFKSASFNAINDAISQGSNIDNLLGLPLVLNRPNNYNPYR